MLLKKILQQTSASPNIVFRDPFKPVETDQLIQEIIGLANLDFAGARYIVFGINKAAMQGSGVVGIDDEKLAVLKSTHQLVATLIKPALQLAFIYDEIDGKLAGAIEIDACDERPYQVACDFSETLTLGQSWTRDGMLFRAAEAGDLALMRPDTGNPDEWKAALGIGSDPDAQHVQLRAPDSSDPPSGRTAQRKGLGGVDWKQATIEAIGTMNTNIARLRTVRLTPWMRRSIRLAVKPGLLGRKMAIHCQLSAANKNAVEQSRLTITFAAHSVDAGAARVQVAAVAEK